MRALFEILKICLLEFITELLSRLSWIEFILRTIDFHLTILWRILIENKYKLYNIKKNYYIKSFKTNKILPHPSKSSYTYYTK